MLKYAKIKGYKTLGEVGMITSHLYQWMSEEVNKQGLNTIIIIRAYDVERPMIFKGIVLNRTLKYYPLEITEDLKEIEGLLGEKLIEVDLKELSPLLKQYKLIKYGKIGVMM